jgi:hypothetical protein
MEMWRVNIIICIWFFLRFSYRFLCVVTDQQVLSWGIMDLVDANDGSGESDPHNSGAAESSSLNGGRSSGGGNIGGSNPSHSQSSSAISIVHVSVPQAQVSYYTLVITLGVLSACLFHAIFQIWDAYLLFPSFQGAIGDTANVRHSEYA